MMKWDGMRKEGICLRKRGVLMYLCMLNICPTQGGGEQAQKKSNSFKKGEKDSTPALTG